MDVDEWSEALLATEGKETVELVGGSGGAFDPALGFFRLELELLGVVDDETCWVEELLRLRDDPLDWLSVLLLAGFSGLAVVLVDEKHHRGSS